MGNLKNIYDMLSVSLPKEKKAIFENGKDASFSSKEAKRGVDYRRSVVDLTIYMQDKIDSQFYNILRNLVEIQEILYGKEENRSSKKILRMYNLAFLNDYHSKQILDTSKTKKMTDRRLFGQYFHNITSHAAPQLRIMPLASAHTEHEERAFNFLSCQ
eukprot:TCONS_00036501-protein